jgi:peptide/nickel transport system permease protein
MRGRASLSGAVGAILVAAILAFGLLAPWLSPRSPEALDLPRELEGPSAAHPLGAGENGIDVLAHVAHGARVSLLVALATTGLSLLLGVALGAAAGLLGRAVDEVLMRLVDVLLAFPGILLSVFITSVLGPAIAHVVLALVITGWVPYARLVRAQVRSLRQREYVEAARALGASPPRILARHLLPNMASPIVVQATFSLPAIVLAEVALSFLGLGVPPGTPSWGALLESGAQHVLVAPHLATFPGLAVMATVLGFNLLGDALRDRLDPRFREAS